jgi:dienelactone hydrolase
MKVLFDDPDFDGQLQRAMSYARHGGADPGECLATAAKVTAGDRDSWYAEWAAAARRLRQEGEQRQEAGHLVSACENFLRASNYWRAAEFYVRDGADGRSLEGWLGNRDCFVAAAPLMEHRVEPVEIPYERSTLPGYLMSRDRAGERRPTILSMTGLDGTAEEVYFGLAAAALQRGYTVLVYDGPGQGGSARQAGTFLRPDWEAVVTPVVDYATARPEVDPGRVALVGRSFGGYLAPRAATVEHRLAAVVADPGQVDMGLQGRGRIPQNLYQSALAGDPAAESELEKAFADPDRRFFIRARMRFFGTATYSDFLRAVSQYRYDPAAIRCPTLVTDNVADPVAGGQARMLYDALTCPKQYLLFTEDMGAGGHCEGLAQSVFQEHVLDWLDETLGNRTSVAARQSPGVAR